jgi:hypothetical protein
MITQSGRQNPRGPIPFMAAAFLLGLAGLVSLKLWLLARMVAAHFS